MSDTVPLAPVHLPHGRWFTLDAGRGFYDYLLGLNDAAARVLIERVYPNEFSGQTPGMFLDFKSGDCLVVGSRRVFGHDYLVLLCNGTADRLLHSDDDRRWGLYTIQRAALIPFLNDNHTRPEFRPAPAYVELPRY